MNLQDKFSQDNMSINTADALKQIEFQRTVKRAEVAQYLHDAKEPGDVIDNAAYEDAKNEQARLEGRILELEQMLAVNRVPRSRASHMTVGLGSKVWVQMHAFSENNLLLEKNMLANLTEMTEQAREITEVLGLPKEDMFIVAAAMLKVKASVAPMSSQKSQERIYTLVGAYEAHPSSGLISCESPVGRALLGHQVGDEITVSTPGGEKKYIILKIE